LFTLKLFFRLPDLPVSVFWLFLLPAFNLGLWIAAPGKRFAAALIPVALLLIFWMFVLFFPGSASFSFKENWLFSQDFSIQLFFLSDSRRVFLACLSSFLTLLIQMYSLAWLPSGSNAGLYHFMLSVFCLAMTGLFLAGNLFTLLIFWELIGFSSYLLVQFWYEKSEPVLAGLRVFLINKAGDLALISALGLLLAAGMGDMVFRSVHIPDGADIFFRSSAGSVVLFFVVLSAMVKSAQFPFSIWLKQAMQGPTPVSALLHSATMVVAGVWLMIQLSPAFAPELQWMLVLTGGFTFLFFNGMALFSGRLKNILAYSTIAQLGMMVLAAGSGKAEASLLHLVAHAFFKAGLFLICGWLMQQTAEKVQDSEAQQCIPNMKGLLSRNPVLKWSFLIFLINLAGWPLSAGFISKEMLLPPVFQGADALRWIAWFMLQAGFGISAFYSFRLALFLAFSDADEASVSRHSSRLISIPVAVMALFCGFWLFGPHPFSSHGVLPGLLGVQGEIVFPDVLMLMAGTLMAWFFSDRQAWRVISFPGGLSSSFSGMAVFSEGINRSAQFLFLMVRVVKQTEQKALDKPLDFAAATFLVGGYFTAFLDKFVVDGLVNGLANLCRSLGSVCWAQARKNPQYVVFFVFVLLGVCLYFSFY
jgi:NADH:ubiquinone oxidoreductase subunit 5 (subunit L)/multisubunit Na+/H+ antiporter MnhA subunit